VSWIGFNISLLHNGQLSSTSVQSFSFKYADVHTSKRAGFNKFLDVWVRLFDEVYMAARALSEPVMNK
jgi:hypothetical protein